jgi:hypothetical protein
VESGSGCRLPLVVIGKAAYSLVQTGMPTDNILNYWYNSHFAVGDTHVRHQERVVNESHEEVAIRACFCVIVDHDSAYLPWFRLCFRSCLATP